MVLLVLPPADHLWIGRNRGPICAISAMQIDDQRVREDARGMLAPGPSCVPRRRSSNANGLCGQNSARILGPGHVEMPGDRGWGDRLDGFGERLALIRSFTQ